MHWKWRPLGLWDFVLSLLLFSALIGGFVALEVQHFGWRDALFAEVFVLLFLGFVFGAGQARQRKGTAPVYWTPPRGIKGFVLRFIIVFCSFLVVRLIPAADNYLLHGVTTSGRELLVFPAIAGLVWAAFGPGSWKQLWRKADSVPTR
jgi:hypothetical protein